MVIILFNTGLFKSVFSTYSFGKLVFYLSAPIVIIASSEFDELFTNLCNICSTYQFSLKQFERGDTRHKNLLIALDKNMPPGSFRVLKNSFINKSVEYLQNERV